VRGDKSVPSLKNLGKLVNKNAIKVIKHQNGVPSQKKFHNPYIPSLPKFGKNLTDPPPGFSNRVHLWVGHFEVRVLIIPVTKGHIEKT
jgi:hypothetical protein